MSGRVQFTYTANPDAPDCPSLLARQASVREIAEQMALACQSDEVPGDGDTPYLDLIVSVPDASVTAWVEATDGHPPTSDVLCEHDLQAVAIRALRMRAEVCLAERLESWEVTGGVALGDAADLPCLGDGRGAPPPEVT